MQENDVHRICENFTMKRHFLYAECLKIELICEEASGDTIVELDCARQNRRFGE
jgi:hypothetical protein